MNFTSSEARAFASAFKKLVENVSNVEIVICAPFTFLESLSSLLSGSNIGLGAQNIFFEEEGIFTGEISARMISPFCKYVIVGHSERRKHFNESNDEVNKKIKISLKHGLKPILCVGESLKERNSGETEKVLKKMVSECLKDISKKDAEKIVVCYEPLWAISKGKKYIAKSNAAPSEMAQETHAFIRSILLRLFGKPVSEHMRILYGGSMKPDNVVSLMSQQDIDGGLVGGASLDPVSFSKVVKF